MGGGGGVSGFLFRVLLRLHAGDEAGRVYSVLNQKLIVALTPGETGEVGKESATGRGLAW